ncbi:MAG: CPBP family intramembrane metalloprotease [Archangiaceae bacterium]|nr:CPBP family intramembrane metalloprotease [Archangiaceae bacterium]
MIAKTARVWLRELGAEPTVIMCGASAFLVISHYQGSTGYFRNVVGNRFDNHPALNVLSYWWWFFSSVLLYLVMPLVLSYATRGSFNRKYGFGLGDWRAGLKVSVLFLVVMLPAAFVASKWKAFQGQYPLAGSSAHTLHLGGGKTQVSLGLFAFYELGYVLYFVAWEFFYRGWMLNGLLPRFGRAGAILIPVAPFAVMHLGKAEPEALGSIVAGVALGILALRTRSFWYGVLVHCSVAVWMDLITASPALFPALFSKTS